MALLLQRLTRTQNVLQQLTSLQGNGLLPSFRKLSTAAPAPGRASSSSKAEGTAPRFYKYVGVTPEPSKDNRIRPFTMPLMSLAATAIDQPKSRQKVIDTMLQYLDTDAICCREEPGKLADMQAKLYNPILAWANQHFDVKFTVNDSIFGAHQPTETHQAVNSFLQGLDSWHLASMESLASSCRSVVLAVAIMHGQLDVQAAITAARLEETYQMDEWGLVEGGHDIDIADMQVRIAGPTVFLRLLQKTSEQKQMMVK